MRGISAGYLKRSNVDFEGNLAPLMWRLWCLKEGA